MKTAKVGAFRPGAMTASVMLALVSLSIATTKNVRAATAVDRAATARIDELLRQNELLVSRVERLEAHLASRSAAGFQGPSRVQAPFEVVDKAGKVVFQVIADPSSSVAPAARGRVQIARGSLDNYVLAIRRANGDASAILAETKFGTGQLQLNDATKERVTVSGDEGLRVKNPQGKPIITLGFNAGNTAKGILELEGLFQVFDATGETMVEAGTAPTGVGVVRVGPGAKCVPMGTLRVPDCIMGRHEP